MPDTASPTNDTGLNSLTFTDVRAALVQHNPSVPPARVQTLARLIAEVSDVLAQLSQEELGKIAKSRASVRQALLKAVARSGPDGNVSSRPKIETSRGAGLGELVDLDTGRGLVDDYATARPMETWAGPVAGAGAIADRLGIARSTLNQWRKRGAVIGLLRGERKLAYPLEQFVDARPLEGVADVLRVARDPRVAWLWMRQPHGALEDATPLQALRDGRADLVGRVAERDFR